MEGFEFFKSSRELYRPKTPAAALKAYETGFNPIEMFIFKSGSTKPLNEEPFDMEAIERLLSRKDLDLEANVVLIGIFEKLIYSHDQETALFAAESINIIENRYNSRIEQLKELLAKDPEKDKDESSEVHSELGKIFFELAMINGSRVSIKKFYFKEAYSRMNFVRAHRKLTIEELGLMVRILLELQLYRNAMDILERESNEKDTDYLFLKAEIAFAMKKYDLVFPLCRELREKAEDLSSERKMLLYYWLGDAQ